TRCTPSKARHRAHRTYPFFFSSRRRHTRFSRDWEFRRVLFRSTLRERPDRRVPGSVPATAAHRRPTPARYALRVTADCRSAAALDRKSVVEGKNVDGGGLPDHHPRLYTGG